MIRAGLRSGTGEASLFIHSRCKQLITAMRAYRYGQKDRTEVPLKDGHDHVVDALRYYYINRDAARWRGGGIGDTDVPGRRNSGCHAHTAGPMYISRRLDHPAGRACPVCSRNRGMPTLADDGSWRKTSVAASVSMAPGHPANLWPTHLWVGANDVRETFAPPPLKRWATGDEWDVASLLLLRWRGQQDGADDPGGEEMILLVLVLVFGVWPIIFSPSGWMRMCHWPKRPACRPAR